MAWLWSLVSGKAPKTPELVEAEKVFTPQELQRIQQQWQQAQGSGGGGRGGQAQGLTQRQLIGQVLGLPWLDPVLASQLFRLVASKADGHVHVEGLVIAKARLERQGELASMEFVFELLDVHRTGKLDAAVLEVAVATCVRLATGGDAAAPIPDHAVLAICQGALRFGDAGSSGSGSGAGADGAAGDGSTSQHAASLSFDGYRKWCKTFPALQRTLATVLANVGHPLAPDGTSTAPGPATAAAGPHGAHSTPPPAPGPAHASAGSSSSAAAGAAATAAASAAVAGRHALQHASARHLAPSLPVLLQLGNLPPASTLLQPIWTWALSSCLPPAQRQEWRLLFSSQRDGKAFNTFFGRISAMPGPTLVLVRDKAGHAFGGYAPLPWAKNGNFYGDMSSFIFSLEPAAQVYPATGINANLQWCGVGFSQLPSGIGFGGAQGAAGQFALYIDSTLDSGMSRPIATYGSPSLASEQLFQVSTVECWLLQPPDEDELALLAASKRGGKGSSGSVLNKAAEDRAIMGFAGMNFHSDGVREPPPEEG